ncbi:hypothetical protein PV11_09887 [Exophiala sideris]|uniref:Uncharacterized protein n=1 Tax=Exophiala sideris TaxID=1016849 RepID=A0A0D1VPX4_9EURO|nr:hypothetical protein PV11_09887 [Exophiala sideris]
MALLPLQHGNPGKWIRGLVRGASLNQVSAQANIFGTVHRMEPSCPMSITLINSLMIIFPGHLKVLFGPFGRRVSVTIKHPKHGIQIVPYRLVQRCQDLCLQCTRGATKQRRKILFWLSRFVRDKKLWMNACGTPVGRATENKYSTLRRAWGNMDLAHTA